MSTLIVTGDVQREVSVIVHIYHGRINVARIIRADRSIEVKSNASGRGVAEIAAAKWLGCETWQVALQLRQAGDSISGKPSVFEARRK